MEAKMAMMRMSGEGETDSDDEWKMENGGDIYVIWLTSELHNCWLVIFVDLLLFWIVTSLLTLRNNFSIFVVTHSSFYLCLIVVKLLKFVILSTGESPVFFSFDKVVSRNSHFHLPIIESFDSLPYLDHCAHFVMVLKSIRDWKCDLFGLSDLWSLDVQASVQEISSISDTMAEGSAQESL